MHAQLAPAVEDAYATLLEAAGLDDLEGLAETPARAARAWAELTSGYDAIADLHAFPAEGYDEVVAVGRIPFYSLCEHHLLPFHGHAHIAYLPSDLVLGLSKFARLVNVYARRLQLQERLTAQIADHLTAALQPRGVAVVIQAEHLCMSMRGVQTAGALTTTSVMRGRFRESPAARAEVLGFLGVNA